MARVDLTERPLCRFCYGTGVEPCDNCGDDAEHECHLDGEEYGPSPCRMGCTPKDTAS